MNGPARRCRAALVGSPLVAVNTVDAELRRILRRDAATRLARRESLARAAHLSGSSIWQRLAGHAVAGATRDCLLLGVLSRDSRSISARDAA